MTNVKISPKGKALLKNKAFSALVAREIVRRGASLSSNGSIEVAAGSKTLTIKSNSSSAS